MFLMTDENDFNTLAATALAGNVQTTVYRLAPRQPSHGVIAPYAGAETLFAPSLTRYDVAVRAGPAPLSFRRTAPFRPERICCS